MNTNSQLATPAKKKHLLLVDDDKNIREIIKEWIKSGSDHYNIIQAGDGASALEKIQKQYFEILITDMKMPHMSGVELITAIGKLPENKRPKCILAMSGDDDLIIDFKTSTSTQKIHILEKPIDQETFLFFFNEQASSL